MRRDTNVQAEIRKDDGAIVVYTNAYVSHRRGRAPWQSSFSINRQDALLLRDRLNKILSIQSPEQGYNP